MQLSRTEGQQRKIAGLNAIEQSADEFVRTMREAAIRISTERGMVSSDELRVVADDMGLQPHHQNAWGGLFRGPHWVPVGRKRSAIPGNHHREIRVWRYQA